MAIPVVDIFAGPGGINEGFSATGEFVSVASIEMDPIACTTLRLRAALRHHRRETGRFPDDYYRFLRDELSFDSLIEGTLGDGWEHARSEVTELELGPEMRSTSDEKIETALASAGVTEGDPWVLVGGPPCQAYSLVGRSRRAHDEGFSADKKHFLYREYLHIVDKFKPPVFVMENVKGLLSHVHSERRMFDRIIEDLSGDGDYEIRSFVTTDPDPRPVDFLIRSEAYRVPQRRHRVILLGVRKDLAHLPHIPLGPVAGEISVKQVIGGLPAVRSEVAPLSQDSQDVWRNLREIGIGAAELRVGSKSVPATNSGFLTAESTSDGMPEPLRSWLIDDAIGGVVQHAPRRHMAPDLCRYAYLAAVTQQTGRTPRVRELPDHLLPKHKNVAGTEAVPFADRFNVQAAGRSSSTIVSHLSKDGHHFIHYDPMQMRSLTVREAARLQTFPDNYWFAGGRTAQFRQVGNAVPPLLAKQLAETVRALLEASASKQDDRAA